MLAKNLTTFCPCPETLREDKLKGDRLIWVRKFKDSQALKLRHGYCLLLIVFSEKWKQKAELKGLKMCIFLRKEHI
jgi:hypothetical protein